MQSQLCVCGYRCWDGAALRLSPVAYLKYITRIDCRSRQNVVFIRLLYGVQQLGDLTFWCRSVLLGILKGIYDFTS